MCDDEEVAALVVDNGSGMCKVSPRVGLGWVDRWVGKLNGRVDQRLNRSMVASQLNPGKAVEEKRIRWLLGRS
jgi:hypothetical protein